MSETFTSKIHGSRFKLFLNSELCTLNYCLIGGAERDRTADPLLAKQVLSQLSYSPMRNSEFGMKNSEFSFRTPHSPFSI